MFCQDSAAVLLVVGRLFCRYSRTRETSFSVDVNHGGLNSSGCHAFKCLVLIGTYLGFQEV